MKIEQRIKQLLDSYTHYALPMLLLIAFGLRWINIQKHSFWYDEALTSLIASLSLSEILSNVAATDHPPGYYLLLHFWLHLGQNDAFIRALPAVFSVATVLVIYYLGHFLFDQSTGLTAAFIMTILPFQVYFAQENRMYALIILIATGTTWLFFKLI
ncbi:MAG: glycosyltransferase family 39 protein, partial [Chloroflexota bacterium]